MLTDIILFVFETILHGLIYILSLPTLLVPPQISAAFQQIFNTVHTFDSIFPVTQLLLALVFQLTALGVIYGIKGILYLYSLVPVIGRSAELPRMNGGDGIPRGGPTVDLHRLAGRKNTVDLR